MVDADLDGVRVEHNVTKLGLSGAKHQIDIWFEFTVGPTRVHVAGEARRRSRAIQKDQVAGFIATLTDLPEKPNGFMVSEHGFQSGAEKLARAHSILLYVFGAGGRSRVLIRNPVEVVDGRMLSTRHVTGSDLVDALHRAVEDAATSIARWAMQGAAK